MTSFTRLPVEHPLVLPDAFARALLNGRKTTVRQVAEGAGQQGLAWAGGERRMGWYPIEPSSTPGDSNLIIRRDVEPVSCPFGRLGDLVWLQETWYAHREYREDQPDPRFVRFDADLPYADGMPANRWSRMPAASLPRWAARHWMRVTNVRVERLHALTNKDALTEGVLPQPAHCVACERGVCSQHQPPRAQYATYWNETHAPEHAWETNPFVWVANLEPIPAPT